MQFSEMAESEAILSRTDQIQLEIEIVGTNSRPNPKAETLIPVFPNGLVGTILCCDSFATCNPLVWARFSIGVIIDPKPAAPAVFKKSRRENSLFYWALLRSPIQIFHSGSSLRTEITTAFSSGTLRT